MKRRNLPYLVKLAIATLVTTIVWMGFEIYRAVSRQPDPEIPAPVIQQLDPDLDRVNLDRVINRISLEDTEIGDTSLLENLDFSSNIESEETSEFPDQVLLEEGLEDPNLQEATQSGEN